MESESSYSQAMAIALQILVSCGYISFENLNARLEEINRDFGLTESDKLSLEKLKIETAELFDALGMEVLDVRDDYKAGSRYLAVVNRESFPDAINRLTLSQTLAIQLKTLLHIIFEDSRCEGIKLETLTTTDLPNKEELLDILLDQGWLLQDNGRLYPSTRLISELDPYLHEQGIAGHTLLPCLGCEQWLLKGKLCENRQCPARLHDRCYESYYGSQRNIEVGTCPQCGSVL